MSNFLTAFLGNKIKIIWGKKLTCKLHFSHFSFLITTFPSTKHDLTTLWFPDSLLTWFYLLPHPSCPPHSFPREHNQFTHLKTRCPPTTAPASLIPSACLFNELISAASFHYPISLVHLSQQSYHPQNLSPKAARLHFHSHLTSFVHIRHLSERLVRE